MSKLSNLQSIIEHQIDDEGLWFQAQTAPEAYLQQALRRLHDAVEDLIAQPTGHYARQSRKSTEKRVVMTRQEWTAAWRVNVSDSLAREFRKKLDNLKRPS